MGQEIRSYKTYTTVPTDRSIREASLRNNWESLDPARVRALVLYGKKMKEPIITARVAEDDGCMIAEVSIGKYQYAMNIDYVPEDKREWFLQVFSGILKKVDYKARAETKKDHEDRLRELCGIK